MNQPPKTGFENLGIALKDLKSVLLGEMLLSLRWLLGLFRKGNK